MKVPILGGNKFFGRHLAISLLNEGHEVTLFNCGLTSDDLGDRVRSLKADRTTESDLSAALPVKAAWDLVYDQIERRAIFAASNDGQNHLPSGGEATRTMNTDRLYSLGFSAEASSSWLKPLIAEIVARSVSGREL